MKKFLLGAYNRLIEVVQTSVSEMARRSNNGNSESFGQRLTSLRKARGMTQQELAGEVEISRRMVAYYEVQADNPPPGYLLGPMAQALGVSVDELLGLERPRPRVGASDNRLLRRLRQIERLSVRDRRHVIQFIDTVLERERLRQKA